MKHQYIDGEQRDTYPAAFGRLCVETVAQSNAAGFRRPAAFGRLCVET